MSHLRILSLQHDSEKIRSVLGFFCLACTLHFLYLLNFCGVTHSMYDFSSVQAQWCNQLRRSACSNLPVLVLQE